MVHKKSTYRLMYKNYGKEIRRRVWHENNSIRERRREEEMSHHSLDESESDCECDESEDDDADLPIKHHPHTFTTYSRPKSILMNSDEQIHRPPTAPARPTPPPPHIPKLQFSPDMSPRAPQRQVTTPTSGSSDHPTTTTPTHHQLATHNNQDLNAMRDSEEATQARGRGGGGFGRFGGGGVVGRREEYPREQVGVMRPGSCTKEYDLIPATSEDHSIHQSRRTTSTKPKTVYKSHQLPLTSHLTRTTRHNYNRRGQVQYVPCGTGVPVANIGDRTSYNVHLHKDQVHPTALKASTMRNKEIEELISQHKRMTLSDWREKKEGMNGAYQN
ncbi:hypothetical protein Pcinc_035536, partial [Petrolisthes cinctipes]